MHPFTKLASVQSQINDCLDKYAKKTTADPAGHRQKKTKAYMKKQEEEEKRRMQDSRKYHSQRPSISDKPKKVKECFDEKKKKWGPCAPASSSQKTVPAPQKKKEKMPEFKLDFNR